MASSRSFRFATLSALLKPTTLASTSRPSTSALAFSTSATINDGTKRRPSPAKVAERVKKLERKRAERQIRAESEKATTMENKVDRMTRQVEVAEQRQIAQVGLSVCVCTECNPTGVADSSAQPSQDFTANVPEFTDDQLDSIYRGLMLATPEQLATPLNAIAGPSSAPSLPSPDDALATSTSTTAREAVWSALEARLDALEQAEMDDALEAWEVEQRENKEEMDAVRAEGRLADRLRERREGKRVDRGVEEAAVTEASPRTAEPTVSRARYLLGRLIELAPKAEEAGTDVASPADGAEWPIEATTSGGEGSLVSVPRGIAVRDEWRSLLLACASHRWFAIRLPIFKLTLGRPAG